MTLQPAAKKGAKEAAWQPAVKKLWSWYGNCTKCSTKFGIDCRDMSGTRKVFSILQAQLSSTSSPGTHNPKWFVLFSSTHCSGLTY